MCFGIERCDGWEPRDTLPENWVRLGIPNLQDSIDLGYVSEPDFTQDSIPPNEFKKKKGLLVHSFFVEDYPNPKKAFWFSLAIPGGGQIYNKRYWKLPFVYAIIGGAGYGVYFNTTEYRKFRRAYENRVNGEPDEFQGIITSLQTLKNITDSYRSSMELSYVFLIGGYLFTAAEALVDAHLKTFDVSEDLSFKVVPVFYFGSAGLGAKVFF